MNLTTQILKIMIAMQIAFSQGRSFKRFGYMIFAILCTAGRHTITSLIFFGKYENEDWTKFYRFFSRRKWKPRVCFDKIAEIVLRDVLAKNDDILIALDDFRVEKTGKTIPYTRYQLDPKSPAFHPNLMWGHRYLHASLLICRKKNGRWGAARSISVRIELAPHVKKPGKRATEDDWKAYEAHKEKDNLCRQASVLIHELRGVVDRLGYSHKAITIVADGGYCNKTIFKNLPSRVDLIVRCRKDAKLCEKSQEKRRFYSSEKFTPYELYKNDSILSKMGFFFYGRRISKIKYKEKSSIYWQRGAQRQTLRVMVIHGVRYRKGKKDRIKYREPMYLLTTDLTRDAKTLIQYYLFRWEIEVTHRELKNDLGISQAQVRHPRSVAICPQTIGIASSIIKLADILLTKEIKGEVSRYALPPKWYKTRKRISLAYMRRRLRQEIVDNRSLKISWRDLFEKIAA